MKLKPQQLVSVSKSARLQLFSFPNSPVGALGIWVLIGELYKVHVGQGMVKARQFVFFRYDFELFPKRRVLCCAALITLRV
jgi:hypothetical protein